MNHITKAQTLGLSLISVRRSVCIGCVWLLGLHKACPSTIMRRDCRRPLPRYLGERTRAWGESFHHVQQRLCPTITPYLFDSQATCCIVKQYSSTYIQEQVYSLDFKASHLWIEPKELHKKTIPFIKPTLPSVWLHGLDIPEPPNLHIHTFSWLRLIPTAPSMRMLTVSKVSLTRH